MASETHITRLADFPRRADPVLVAAALLEAATTDAEVDAAVDALDKAVPTSIAGVREKVQGVIRILEDDDGASDCALQLLLTLKAGLAVMDRRVN